jgi:hypothetical protein
MEREARTGSASKELLVGPRFNEIDGDLAKFGDYAHVRGLEKLQVLLVLIVKHQQHDGVIVVVGFELSNCFSFPQ